MDALALAGLEEGADSVNSGFTACSCSRVCEVRQRSVAQHTTSCLKSSASAAVFYSEQFRRTRAGNSDPQTAARKSWPTRNYRLRVALLLIKQPTSSLIPFLRSSRCMAFNTASCSAASNDRTIDR